MFPVDMPSFLKDERVQQIVEASKPKVKIGTGSVPGLIPLNGKISGLKDDKYYLMEKVVDDEGSPVEGYPKYITDHIIGDGPGGMFKELGFISRISDGNINNLTNFYIYTVKVAQPFPDGTVNYTDDTGPQSTEIIDGKINISNPQGIIILDLSDQLDPGVFYEVMAVAVSSTTTTNWNDIDIGGGASNGANSSITRIADDWDDLPLEGEDTTVDYIFVEVDADGNPVIPVNFKVLQVVIGPTIQPDGLTITIEFEVVDDAPRLTSDNYTFSQSKYYNDDDNQKVTINVSDPSGYTFEWFDETGAPVGTAGTLTITNTSAVNYFSPGEHTFTLIAKKGDVYYSADFTIVVVP
jgi:hypothetical protein